MIKAHAIKNCLLLLLLLSSCIHDKLTDEPYRSPSFLTIEGSLPEKQSEETTWMPNSMLGVFLLNQQQGIVNNYENKRYLTADGSGNFIPANKYNDAVAWPNELATAHLQAYSPYQSELKEGAYRINLSEQEVQENIKLLYADTLMEKPANQQAKLHFQCQLTKVIFHIEADETLGELVELSTSISNMCTTADFLLNDASITHEANPANINCKTQLKGRQATSEAIVLPTEAASRKFILKYKSRIGTRIYEVDASKENFEKGKKHSYQVKLTKDEESITISSNIDDWKPGSSEDIIIPPNGGGETEPDVEYVEKECFAESFGKPADTENPTDEALSTYAGFDMKSPVSYTEQGPGLLLKTIYSRFPDNHYFLTIDAHKGNAEQNKTCTISGIESKGYKEMMLSFDFAAGNAEMTFNDVKIVCNGVEVPLPAQGVKNRDRFETVSISIPDETNQIDFVVKEATKSYMRIDNIIIKGKVAKEKF